MMRPVMNRKSVHRCRRGRAVLAAALAATVLAPGAVPAPASAAAPAFTGAGPIEVVSSERLGPRLHTVRVRTAALGGRPVDVRVLVPAGYDDAAAARRRYPVLYLFHGTSGRAADWTTMGDAERTTAGRDLIVVMPDAGFDGDGGGWFTDWFGTNGAGGPPKWETFHIRELLPWIDRTLRTVAERRGRAVYGLSQGGYGAMSYAARHPDLFAAAGSFSGAVNTTADAEAQAYTTPIVEATAVGLSGRGANEVFGPRTTQQLNWAAHDPATLAGNLRGMDLRLTTRNGRPGPLDDAPNPPSMVIEAGVRRLTQLFQGHLDRLGIPSSYHDEGPGQHTWGYWARDLRGAVPALMELFARPRPAPARITHQAAEARFSAWGWDVEMRRPAAEFATLKDAAADGFALSGSGSARVTTPPVYAPRSAATVRLRAPTTAGTERLVADAAGRLRIEVPLGPGNPDQAMTAAAALRGTRVFTTQVRIDGIARPRACVKRRAAAGRRGTARGRAPAPRCRGTRVSR